MIAASPPLHPTPYFRGFLRHGNVPQEKHGNRVTATGRDTETGSLKDASNSNMECLRLQKLDGGNNKISKYSGGLYCNHG
jgi:hypothetical protein